MPLLPLDGPAKQDVLTIDNITVVEVKIDASAMEDRKVVTLQPDGKIRVYFGDANVAAPNAATMLTDGFIHNKDTIRSYEAGGVQPVYILSDTGGSVDVVVAERA